MIYDFQTYLDSNMAKKSSPDRNEAKSLIDKAFQRMSFVDTIRIDETNATFVFEDVYEAIREAGQSIMSLEGYKPYSHEALIAFLKEFCKFDDGNISKLDRYRVIRNGCVYRAEKVSADTCKNSIIFAKTFMLKLKVDFERRYKK